MLSLEEICYQNITNTMLSAPPLIQEIVAGETKKRMIEKVRKEVEEKITREMEKYLPSLVPMIMDDIVRATIQNSLRMDYYTVYSHIPIHIVKIAINVAEESVRTLEEHFETEITFNNYDTHAHTQRLNSIMYNSFETNSDSDSDTDSYLSTDISS